MSGKRVLDEKRRREEAAKTERAISQSSRLSQSRNSSSTNQGSQEDLKRLYTTAVALYGNKKISRDNAFSLKLLDCFGHLVKKDLKKDEINSIANALEACTKIFVCRVDLTHSTITRITNDIINRTGMEGGMNKGILDATHNGTILAPHDDNVEEPLAGKKYPKKGAIVSEENAIVLEEFAELRERFDENGDRIDQEEDELAQVMVKRAQKTPYRVRGFLELESNLSLESEFDGKEDSAPMKKFKANFQESIKTRKAEDFFYQYEKLTPTYTERLKDPDSMKKEMEALMTTPSFPRSLELKDDGIDLEFMDVNMNVDFDPFVHNIWGYKMTVNEVDSDSDSRSTVASFHDNTIGFAHDEIEEEEARYDPKTRPDVYPEVSSIQNGDRSILPLAASGWTNEDGELLTEGLTINDFRSLDELELYFNKVRATKGKKVDLFRLFSKNMGGAGRKKFSHPKHERTSVHYNPLTEEDLSVFNNNYRPARGYDLANTVDQSEWKSCVMDAPFGSYSASSSQRFDELSEVSRTMKMTFKNGRKVFKENKTKELFKYFMDEDQDILGIMKKNSAAQRLANPGIVPSSTNNNQSKDMVNTSCMDMFANDSDGDCDEGFEVVRRVDEYCFENPGGDCSDRNSRLAFDRKSGGFVDVGSINTDFFEDPNCPPLLSTVKSAEDLGVLKSGVDMHFLKTVIQGILKTRFGKDSPLRMEEYTFDSLLKEIWNGTYIEDSEQVTPSMTLASLLHVCTDCGFILEVRKQKITNDGEQEESTLNEDGEPSNVQGDQGKKENGDEEDDEEVIYIMPIDGEFTPSSI